MKGKSVNNILALSRNLVLPKLIRQKFYELSYLPPNQIDPMPPYICELSCAEGNYYMLEHYYYIIINLMNKGCLFNESLEQISTKESLAPYLNEYGIGFRKGYFNFQQSLKQDGFFDLSNQLLAYKVFDRLYKSPNKKGGVGVGVFKDIEVMKSTQEKHNIPMCLKIDISTFHSSGFAGGEYYMAWEIVLNNYDLFKNIFSQYFGVKERKKVTNSYECMRQIFTNNNGTQIIADLKAAHFNDHITSIKKPLFWIILLCKCHELDLLVKNVTNANIVILINKEFNQKIAETNLTTYSKFKKGDWIAPKNEYDFSFLGKYT